MIAEILIKRNKGVVEETVWLMLKRWRKFWIILLEFSFREIWLTFDFSSVI